MILGEGACLVCGKPLEYHKEARELHCMFCGKVFESHAACEDGHHVCDRCHADRGIEAVTEICRRTGKKDPVAIAQEVMDTPYVHMHGPEHHILVGSALLTAYKNAGGSIDLPAALEEMKKRGSRYPGGSCGYWGCCGAAVSAGMFMSIVTGATPLSGKEWGLSNRLTARCLQAIGDIGGPRCCKRNSFTALREATAFVREELGVPMEMPEEIRCAYASENKQCLGRLCPYRRGG